MSPVISRVMGKKLVGLEQYRHWVIGYWGIFADIGWYCYWKIFFHCDTQYDTDQTAVSTLHMITIKTSVVWPLSANDGRESDEGVECKLYSILSIVIIIDFEILRGIQSQ